MSVIDEIAAERRRQIEAESWTAEHDDTHVDGEMALAASAYAYVAAISDDSRKYVSGIYSIDNDGMLRDLWPRRWARSWWKPKTRRRDLLRAAALIVAEIERLDRARGADA